VDERPFVSRVINKLAHYEGGIVPNVEQESPADDAPPIDSPEVVAGGAIIKKKKKKKKAAPKKASEDFSVQRAENALRLLLITTNCVRYICCSLFAVIFRYRFCHVDNATHRTLINCIFLNMENDE